MHSFVRNDGGGGLLLIVFDERKQPVFAVDAGGELYNWPAYEMWTYEQMRLKFYFTEYT